MTENYLQIDALHIATLQGSFAVMCCTVNTPYGCFPVYMPLNDYGHAMKAGFFIRDGIEPDGAGCINTTEMFLQTKPQTK